MQTPDISATGLEAEEYRSISGTVRIEGWLVVENSERAWLAASSESAPTPVVHIEQSKQIHDLLIHSRVSPLGGGPYAFVNRATLTGSHAFSNDEYTLSEVDEIAVCEMVNLWLKPLTPLSKKTDD